MGFGNPVFLAKSSEAVMSGGIIQSHLNNSSLGQLACQFFSFWMNGSTALIHVIHVPLVGVRFHMPWVAAFRVVAVVAHDVSVFQRQARMHFPRKAASLNQPAIKTQHRVSVNSVASPTPAVIGIFALDYVMEKLPHQFAIRHQPESISL